MSARFYRDDADTLPIDWIAWLLRALIAGIITILAGVNNGVVLLF